MTEQPRDDGAAGRLAARFDPDGLPGYTLEGGRAWTSEQVRQVLDHHREHLRQIIEPDVREVLRELDEARAEAAQAQAQSHADLQSAIKYNAQREKAGQVTSKAWNMLTQAELDRDHARNLTWQLARAIEAYVPDSGARAFHLAGLPDWATAEHAPDTKPTGGADV